MVYHTVKVENVGSKWVVTYTKSDVEREETKTIPNAMGFYHYPSTMSDKEAVHTLVDAMVIRHTAEIERLTESKIALSDLLYEELSK
jgi:hypothetical protein